MYLVRSLLHIINMIVILRGRYPGAVIQRGQIYQIRCLSYSHINQF